MPVSKYSEITPEIQTLASFCTQNGTIDPTLYTKYDVKRGLRDLNGNGVLTGLTGISEIRSSKIVDGESSTPRASSSTAAIISRISCAACPPTTASALR